MRPSFSDFSSAVEEKWDLVFVFLKKCPQLKVVYLHGIQGLSIVEKVGEAVGFWPVLEEIDFSFVEIGPKGAKLLSDSLNCLLQLTALSLDYNWPINEKGEMDPRNELRERGARALASVLVQKFSRLRSVSWKEMFSLQQNMILLEE